MADQRRLFQLFTESKDIALKHKTGNGKVMDQIIELWTRMTEAAYEHDEHVISNVRGLQHDADQAVQALREQ